MSGCFAVARGYFAAVRGCFHPFALLLVFSIFISCQFTLKPTIIPGFYLWQTEIALDLSKKNYLDTLQCQKLYLKFLDIGLNPSTLIAEPLANLNLLNAADFRGKQIIPTVFITNETFKTVKSEVEIENLAKKIATAIFQIGENLPQNEYTEIQFDCDWTATTRDAYFSFLEKIKKHFLKKTQISATIRLHQYKFPSKTGIPPVQRGMLMFYNTGDITDILTENSIFNPEDAQKYLIGAPKTYPLPLDIALPLFSWAIIFREGVFWRIIASPDLTEIADNSNYQKKSNNLYQVLSPTLLEGHYLRPDDWIKIEAIDTQRLLSALDCARKIPLHGETTLAFFQLDALTQLQFPPQFLKKVCDSLQFSPKQ
jgi:hypothetical protein